MHYKSTVNYEDNKNLFDPVKAKTKVYFLYGVLALLGGGILKLGDVPNVK